MTTERPYAAFLRGVSPLNARMPALQSAFEAAGFTDVRTLLSSGNVVFRARPAAERTLARRAEAAMQARLGRTFLTFVRPVAELEALLASDPYARFRLPAGAKRVVTFLQATPEPEDEPELPLAWHDARVLCREGRTVLSVYVPSPRGPAFMALLERTYGKDVTTRTWDTVRKVAGALGTPAPAQRRRAR